MQRLILLVDDRDFSRDLVSTELTELGYEVFSARDGYEGWDLFQAKRFDLVVTDLRMPRSDGMMLLRRIRSAESNHPQVPVLLMSAYATFSAAMAAGRDGATDFYQFNDSGIEQLVERVSQILSVDAPELPTPLLGESSGVRQARERVHSIAKLPAPVFIRGESGSGRAEVARYIHRLSRHASHDFSRIDAPAAEKQSGLPSAGTVYLEGIDGFSEAAQSYWLECIRAIEQLGSRASLRIIASSGRDLRLIPGEANFNEALAGILLRFNVTLPPLRDRLEDLDKIAISILKGVCDRLGRHVSPPSQTVLDRLRCCPWHGNLAELERVLESVVAYTSSAEIDLQRVDEALEEMSLPVERIAEERALDERQKLIALYRKHGTFSGIARELGITRNAAKYRLAKHDLIRTRGKGAGS